jgi:hypothetical protein
MDKKIDSELLKNAICDAKAIRATALANAKNTLVEAFSPKFQAMFAEKLKEEAEEESFEEQMEEGSQTTGVKGNVPTNAVKVGTGLSKAVSKGKPHTGSDDVKLPVGVGDPSGPSQTKPMASNTINETEEVAVEEAGVTDEDLDEIIRELESEVSADEAKQEMPPVPPAPEDAVEEPAEVPPPVSAPPQFGEPDGDEAPVAPAPVAPGDPNAPVIPHAEPDGDEVPATAPVAEPTDEKDEEISLDELLAALNEEAEEEGGKEEKEEEKMDEIKNNGLSKEVGGQDGALKAVSGKDPTSVTWKGANKGSYDKPTKKLSEDNSGLINQLKEENAKLKAELNEYKKGVEFLDKQINEINLLNAKLLYTNKLFKEFSLNNNQKMKIVESFDLTKNIREVKMAYALIFESFNNFGGKVNKKTDKVSQITEGLSSKPVASTKPTKEIISEAETKKQVNRLQELAGIIKK